ncbi:MAG TPA: SprT family zinc-dependent metalloprotease [Candidatus Limnocylindrales bacterium]|nr:SprT family zinc-dependent metalloprotease [Candidatus Limnocylindrales bacterium]
MTVADPDEQRWASLTGGRVRYVLRRSPRSRNLRVTIDPRRGVLVSVPPATRRGWARPEPEVERFLREREPWLRRHLARQATQQATLAARGGIRDGAEFRYLGELHRLRIAPAPGSARRSTVERAGADDRDELVLRVASRDRRAPAAVLEAWLRARAAEAIDRSVAEHAQALGVRPERVTLRDPKTRWGSATRRRTLSFSWRLILAPPAALETVVVHELAHLRVFGHGPGFWALVAARRPDHTAWRRWLRVHSQELHAALDGGLDRAGGQVDGQAGAGRDVEIGA